MPQPSCYSSQIEGFAYIVFNMLPNWVKSALLLLMFYPDMHVLLYYCFMSLSRVTIKQLFTFFVCNHRQFAFHPWTLIFVSLGDNKQFEHYFGPENQGSKKSHKEGDTPPTAILPTKDTGLLSVDTRTLKAAYQLGCHPGMYVEDKLIQLCSSHFPAKNLQFMNRIVFGSDLQTILASPVMSVTLF